MSQEQASIYPVVELVNERPATTSLAIAECFDKRHCDVMRDIQNLIENCPGDFHKRNFALMSRKVKIGNGAEREEPYYIVFFDGFILLVMGYTGKKALQMKLAYIEAFNAMRAKLEAQKQHPLPNGWRLRKGASPKVIERAEHCTHGEAVPIEKAVDAWCAEKNIRRLDALAAIRVRFGLKIFDRPPRHLHDDILAWINEQRGTSGKKPKLAARGKLSNKELAAAVAPALPAAEEGMENDRVSGSFPKLAQRLAECGKQLDKYCAKLRYQGEETPGFPGFALSLAEAVEENMAAMRASMEVMDTWLKYIKIICRSAAEQIRQEKTA